MSLLLSFPIKCTKPYAKDMRMAIYSDVDKINIYKEYSRINHNDNIYYAITEAGYCFSIDISDFKNFVSTIEKLKKLLPLL